MTIILKYLFEKLTLYFSLTRSRPQKRVETLLPRAPFLVSAKTKTGERDKCGPRRSGRQNWLHIFMGSMPQPDKDRFREPGADFFDFWTRYHERGHTGGLLGLIYAQSRSPGEVDAQIQLKMDRPVFVNIKEHFLSTCTFPRFFLSLERGFKSGFQTKLTKLRKIDFILFTKKLEIVVQMMLV